MKTRYRFSHRGNDGRYYWYAICPVDSRMMQFSCSVEWFWRTP